jgi:hypothetical protein
VTGSSRQALRLYGWIVEKKSAAREKSPLLPFREESRKQRSVLPSLKTPSRNESNVSDRYFFVLASVMPWPFIGTSDYCNGKATLSKAAPQL